jgi:hypothetical protein
VPHRSWSLAFPYASIVVGMALGVWRFREDDPLGGLVATYGGVLLMIVSGAILSPKGNASDGRTTRPFP